MAYQPKSYRKFIAGAAAAAVVAPLVVPVAANAAGLSDIAGHRNEAAINALVDAGIISGYPDGTFQPNKEITRAEAAIMIARALDLLDGENIPASTFSDVAAGTASYEAIVKLAAKGIISGFPDGTFRGSELVTRGQMAKYIVGAYNLQLGDGVTNFPDVSASSSLAKYIDAVVDAGIAGGYTNGNYGYGDNLKRGDFAKMVYNAENIDVDLAITQVSALDDTNKYLSVQFNQPVSDIDAADITIQDAKKGDRFGVNTVTLSKDGRTATLELFENTENDLVLKENTEYTVTVNVNGEIVEGTFFDAAFTEARVVDINVADNEFTIIDNDADEEKTIEVVGDVEFDYQAALGELVRVWYNDDNELVKYEIADASTVLDAIEITDTDEIKLISTGEKIDISSEQYDNDDAKFKFYINGEDITARSDSDETALIPQKLADKGQKINFAKVGYDKSGDVEYISAYSLNDFLIVDSVDDEDVVGVTGDGTGGSFDASDATIVKDGKVIALSDIKEGDVVFFDTKADNGDGYAVVYNKTVTGSIDNVYYDKIEVDGKNYTFARGTGTLADYSITGSDLGEDNDSSAYSHQYAVYINEDGETEEVKDSDKAEELQAAGDVTLYVDPAGNLVYIKGDTADIAQNNVSAILTSEIKVDTDYSTAKAKLEVVLEDGTEDLYDLTLEDLDKISFNGEEYDISDDPDADEYGVTVTDTHIVLTSGDASDTVSIPLFAAGTLLDLHFDDDDNVDELKFYTTAGDEEGYGTSSSTVEAGDDYMAGKKLLDSTVVFDGTDGYDADDITATTWGDYSGSDIQDADFIYNDDNEVVALVINDTTTSDATYETAVITDRLRNTDNEITQIKAYVNGSVQTYDVDDVDITIAKGDVVVLEFDDSSSDLVKDIFKNNDTIDADAGLDATDFVTGPLTVKSVNVGERTVTFTNGVTYKLISDGKVLDGTDPDDITVEALSDLDEAGIQVTVALDEENTKFANYFVFEPASASEDTTAPAKVTGLAFEDTDLDANQVAGEVKFTASTSTDVVSTKVFLGDTQINAVNGKYTIAENTALASQIKVVVADAAGNEATTTFNVTDVTDVVAVDAVTDLTNTTIFYGFTTVQGKYDADQVDKIDFFVANSTTARTAELNDGTFSRDIASATAGQELTFKAYKGSQLVDEGTYTLK